MVNERNDAGGEPRQFAKNRFFEGKLMTARDMRTEQQYHAGRLELVTRETADTGVCSGLELRSVETVDEGLAVTVGPGVAIDAVGRPIVVESPTTASVPEPTGDELYIFARFDEVDLEPVAVPDAGGSRSEPESNRIVERFELTAREQPPEGVSPPSVDIEVAEDDAPATVADRLLAAAHEAGRSESDAPAETAVYLGGFERGPDGAWQPSETAPGPTYAATTDLLLGAFVDHIADTDNPHRTTTEAEPPTPELDPAELEGIHERVDYLQSELSALKDRHRRTATHLRLRSLDTTARRFRAVADTFADHDGAVSTAAREVARQAAAASQAGAGDEPASYRSTVRELHAALAAFGDNLAGTAREPTVDRYLDAVAALQSTIEADEPAVDVAIALDRVAEAAAGLERLHPVAAEA
ncbi:MAG: hypothetical protein R6V31_11220 [Halohasta sp.]